MVIFKPFFFSKALILEDEAAAPGRLLIQKAIRMLQRSLSILGFGRIWARKLAWQLPKSPQSRMVAQLRQRLPTNMSSSVATVDFSAPFAGSLRALSGLCWLKLLGPRGPSLATVQSFPQCLHREISSFRVPQGHACQLGLRVIRQMTTCVRMANCLAKKMRVCLTRNGQRQWARQQWKRSAAAMWSVPTMVRVSGLTRSGWFWFCFDAAALHNRRCLVKCVNTHNQNFDCWSSCGSKDLAWRFCGHGAAL